MAASHILHPISVLLEQLHLKKNMLQASSILSYYAHSGEISSGFMLRTINSE